MGQDTRSVFQYLKDEGYAFLIGGFHVKGQVINSRGVSAWGYGGQTLLRGDRVGDQPATDAAARGNAWKKQTVLAEHELPGTARHDRWRTYRTAALTGWTTSSQPVSC